MYRLVLCCMKDTVIYKSIYYVVSYIFGLDQFRQQNKQYVNFNMIMDMVQFLNEFWSRDNHGQLIFINWEVDYNLMMQILHKLLLNLALAVSLLVLLYALFTGDKNTAINSVSDIVKNDFNEFNSLEEKTVNLSVSSMVHENQGNPMVHLWCILTKVDVHAHLKLKFQVFLTSLTKFTSPVTLHIISDEKGQQYAEDSFDALHDRFEYSLKMYFYDVTTSADLLQSIVSIMKPYFSSSPGSYYSDSLFFLSLGLHKIAPQWMSRCILVDIDTQFQSDPLLLWTHFDHFSSSQLIGLAPELSPVYRHTFFTYRTFKHALKIVGEPHSEGGYSGFNSGVILLHLDRLRESEEFAELCSVKNVKALTKKFSFHGHLGDQDFYTLLGIEHPHLIYVLPCTWNRQLCTWWSDHGYANVFHRFFKCEGKVHLYHGNCNTQIPSL